MNKEFDVLVLGGGPGGYTAAIRAAQLGAKVGLVEKDSLGGTCLNRGCIPTKALRASAYAVYFIKKASKFGIEVNDPKIDWTAVQSRKSRIVTRLVKGVEFLIRKNKIEPIKGTGELSGDKTVRVDNTMCHGNKVIIATGSNAHLIPDFNINHTNILDSTDFLNMPTLPKSILVVGGGVMGVEFATIMNLFGVETTICEMEKRILPTEDEEISNILDKKLQSQGIKIITGQKITTIKDNEENTETILTNGDKIIAEKVVISIGRKMNIGEIGKCEINIENHCIQTNEKMETNIPGIYAVGDVTGISLFAHIAMAQAKVAAENAMGKNQTMNYNAIPAGIMTIPEVGRVGLTEKQAIEKGLKVKVGKFSFHALGKAQCLGEADGMVKIIIEETGHKILGAQIIGPRASDLIQEIVLAMENNLNIENIIKTIHAHPTLSESLLEAAENSIGNAIHI